MTMSRRWIACLLATGVLASIPARSTAQTQWEKARERLDALRFESYATSRQVEQMATDEEFRARVGEAVRRMGITKMYVEVYRAGHTVPPELLVIVRDWLVRQGIDVVGGIATVPGGDVGVRQQGPLDWFNWQNAKTQRDLEEIVRMAAGVFDTFIVDDFLCTGDVGEESDRARGERSWGQYRRELLTQLARSVLLEPAREVNPDIIMIVKYPQWYDRFHLFGYDTETLPRIFDRVWVGTETRGRNTRRFGFVQPYEGFINYRWLASSPAGRSAAPGSITAIAPNTTSLTRRTRASWPARGNWSSSISATSCRAIRTTRRSSSSSSAWRTWPTSWARTRSQGCRPTNPRTATPAGICT